MMRLSHSHSSIEQYINCPWRFYRQRIVKDIKDEMGKAAEFGIQAHSALEYRVRDGKPLAPNFAMYEPLARQIEQIPGQKHFEMKLGLTAELTSCGFFDKQQHVWLRGVGDVVIDQGKSLVVIDYKFGTDRGSTGQEHRMALLGFAHFANASLIKTRFLYVQEGHSSARDFRRSELHEIAQPTRDVVADIEWSQQHNRWPKKPTGLCKQYCPVSDCEYHGKGARR